jgi:hypothetical protein
VTKREKYLIDQFKISEDIVKIISEIGRRSNTHKYDVWIAKEFKKNNSILDTVENINYIIDWAQQEKPNIYNLSYDKAMEESKLWHEQLHRNPKKTFLKIKEENEQILYRSKDGNYVFLLLKPEELDFEGQMMSNCVGTYKDRVKNGHCFIVSLRDKKNEAHVTIEIDAKYGDALQVKAKGNQEVPPKYQKYILEFALFASSSSEEDIDSEILEIINTHFESR